MIHHPPIVKTLLWPNEAATMAFAGRLAAQPALGQALIALHGDLGTGKTTLVRHLLQALGVGGRIKSPTYTVVESYALPAQANGPAFPVWHFDFYRFNDPQEWEDAGFRDIFATEGLKLVEWPQKAAGLLPAADLDVELYTQPSPDTAFGSSPESSPDGSSGSGRRVVLRAHTAVGVQLLEALA